VFAKRRRTGVVRLFCVLLSLVFGGGRVDIESEENCLAFLRFFFQKKLKFLLKFESFFGSVV